MNNLACSRTNERICIFKAKSLKAFNSELRFNVKLDRRNFVANIESFNDKKNMVGMAKAKKHTKKVLTLH